MRPPAGPASRRGGAIGEAMADVVLSAVLARALDVASAVPAGCPLDRPDVPMIPVR
ncbi:Hypothetical protein I596_361 [Dokdonella koreensis DS-123]|uniref:Uncharacterized protein n=1 Tax=Dokdonella koreensis DS-123 TaxID=1300342 RepID=A0A167GCA2_9GAMM|nr:Hypothetical protein I596_361 [Dokdonella koreensis DS-123]